MVEMGDSSLRPLTCEVNAARSLERVQERKKQPIFVTATAFLPSTFCPFAFALSVSFRVNCRKIVVTCRPAQVRPAALRLRADSMSKSVQVSPVKPQ